MRSGKTPVDLTNCVVGWVGAAVLLGFPPGLAQAGDALSVRPDPSSPASVMHWAMNLDLRGWDYLGSADDSIFFVSRPRVLPNGHKVFGSRAEFFDHSQVGEISSLVAEMEVDCDRFKLRRISTRSFAAHNLTGKVLFEDHTITDWFSPPGNLVPASATGACLAR